MSQDKPGFFRRLLNGLAKTRANLSKSFSSVFGGSAIDDDFYEELEEILIMADMGVATTESVIENLKKEVKERRLKEPEECRQLLMDLITAQMKTQEAAYEFENTKSALVSTILL